MTSELSPDTISSLVVNGDLSKLDQAQRAQYYVYYCQRLGLDPATQPFSILRLNGKEILYATRGATDQLASKHRLRRKTVEGPEVRDFGGVKLIYCKVEVSTPDGRTEEATATLPANDVLNGLMKAETKAKRRATLSILGLGISDEMEVETIPGAITADPPMLPAPSPGAPPGVHVTASTAAQVASDAMAEKIRKATAAELIQPERIERMARLSKEHKALVAQRWVELVKTPGGAETWKRHPAGEWRDAILRAFDAAGIDARDFSDEAA